MIGTIYKWTCLLNNKSYIGSTLYPEKRKKEHIRDANKANPGSSFHKDLKKYGESNFTYEELEYCEEESMLDCERYWISYFDSVNNGYNNVCGAQGRSRSKHTKDSKLHISISQKKYWSLLSKEEKQDRLKCLKHDASGENNPMYRHNHTEKTKQQISITKKNNYVERCWVNKNGIQSLIPCTEYDKYIAEGWSKGRK